MAAPESGKGVRRCPKCFDLVDPDTNACLDLACPLRDGPEGEDAAVYPQLARANLHRIHGEYQEASSVCRSILMDYPGNLSAHTLMGDIAAEDGRLSEAVEWYELALDLEPGRAPERRKLEAVRRRLNEQEAAATAEQLGLPTQAPRAKLFMVATVLFVAFIGLAGFFLNDFVRGRQAATLVNRAPIDIPSAPVAPPATLPDATAPTEPSGTSTVAPPTPEPSSAAMPDIDTQTLGGIRARVPGGDHVIAALMDPRSGDLTVTVEGRGEDPRTVAVNLGIALLDETPSASRVTVRVVEGTQLVLVGDVLRSDLTTARDTATTGGDARPTRPQVPLQEEWTPQAQPTSPESR